jgi:hypothetical protein
MIYQSFKLFSVLNLIQISYLTEGLPRGAISLADTGSAGSVFVVRWIKMELDVPDGSIPLRLSDLLGSPDHDRMVGIKGKRELTRLG